MEWLRAARFGGVPRVPARIAIAITLGTAVSLSGAPVATAATLPHSTAAGLIASEASHDAHASQPARTIANSGSQRTCRATAVAGRPEQSCFALKRNGIHPLPAKYSPDAIPAGYGYGPAQLQAAYNLTAASASLGAGRTIAIVDAYDYPTAASDLAAYRSAAGLPPVPSFTKVNQDGQASPLPLPADISDDWTVEEALDLDMASATCPLCNLVLVEADDDSSNGLDIAQNTAAALAGYVSNSWGQDEYAGETGDDAYFNHPGVVITVASGDTNYGAEAPATSPYVVSVGGTSLSPATNARGWTESVWSDGKQYGTGSGCSQYEPQPAWQKALALPAGCPNRIDNDIAADADPTTGVAVYDTYNQNNGWNEVGGTSASAPMVAGMYALAGKPGAAPAADPYTHTGNFNDITDGNDGTCSPAYLCTAGPGYDGPTGIGTPNGIAGLITAEGTGNTVTVTNPGSQTGAVDIPASLQVQAGDSAPGHAVSYSASLPDGLSINTGTGLISGTPTTPGSYQVVLTARDNTNGVAGSTSLSWTIGWPKTACGPTGNIVTNANFADGPAGWATTPAPYVITPWAFPFETPMRGSTYLAQFNNNIPAHPDSIAQTVTMPSGCSGTLSVWLHIDATQTPEINGTLSIQVGGTTLDTFSTHDQNIGYTVHNYQIPAAESGKPIELLFTGIQNNTQDMWFDIGQVNLVLR